MRRDSSWWLLVPAPVRRLPPDVATVCLLVAATGLAVGLPVVRTTPIRILVGVPFVLVAPGYVVVAALFPGTDGDGGLDGVERAALSVATSIALVPLVGLAIHFSVGLTVVTAYLGITALTLAGATVAVRRRASLPPGDRLAIPYRSWFERGRTELRAVRRGEPGSVVLAGSLLLASVGVGVALVAPPPGDGYTEFYLLTEDRTGDLEAADYTEFAPGETRSLYVGVGNREREQTVYTVVALLGPVDGGNGTGLAANTTELDRFRAVVPAGETWRTRHNVTAPSGERRVRLTYLLYVGDAPDDPSVASAYREVHLFLDVSGPSTGREDTASVDAAWSRSRYG